MPLSISGWRGLALIVLFHAPAWADDTARLSADHAVALALAAHPVARAAEVQIWTAEAARSRAAVVLGNPQISAWATPDLGRASLTVQQPLSLSGEGWHARAAARHQLESAESSLSRTRREVAAETRLAYVQASAAVGRVDVAGEGEALAERLSYAVTRKYEEGEASLLDLRLVRLAQVRASVRLMQARKDEAEALRALTAWTLQSIRSADLAPDPLAAAPSPSAEGDLTERSDVVAARRALEAARAQLSQERARALPPVSVGVGIEVEDSQTFAGPSIGLTLPLFDRNQEDRAQARGALALAEVRLAGLTASATTEQTTAQQRVDEAERLSGSLGADLAAQARKALTSIEAGVQAGEIDLSTAILLQAQVLDGETAIVALRALVASARIDLALATDDDALLGGAP